jgi:hypothetical protein
MYINDGTSELKSKIRKGCLRECPSFGQQAVLIVIYKLLYLSLQHNFLALIIYWLALQTLISPNDSYLVGIIIKTIRPIAIRTRHLGNIKPL